MHIGIDFDNTLICYDGVFHRVAVSRGLIPAQTSTHKNAVRDYLRQQNREEEWTVLQGLVYGPYIHEAKPYNGVMTFLEYCLKQSIPVSIVSHKTRFPFLGDKHDLHESARKWIKQHSLLKQVVFYPEETKLQKLDRIKNIGCTHFVDDLPEILMDAHFDINVQKILFDPHKDHDLRREDIFSANSWFQILENVQGIKGC